LLPHPYEAKDRKAGYRYQISILQAEFSLTQVLDRPVTGRVFFEDVIHENLDIGPPSLHIDYKNPESSNLTKEGAPCAPKPPSTIRATSEIGKLLKNLPAVRQIGFQANRRLLDVQKISHDCSIGEDAFDRGSAL
jgi:hypothetical protein